MTCNHTHLLLWAQRGDEVSRAIQFLHGRVGQEYNKMKKRQGAFWTDRHHATLIQSGSHLSKCLFYIDFNLLRAGAIEHPRDWDVTGCRELLGIKQRYRVIDRKRLLQCLAIPDWEHFLPWYQQTMETELERRYFHRQAFWSEALAVGDREWLESVAPRVSTRKRKVIRLAEKPEGSAIGEASPVYYLAGS